jgi:hypothetical protein
MAALSDASLRSLAISLTSATRGNEVATAINKGEALVSQSALCIAAGITATNVSQTIDFAALQVGDKVLMIPATAGSADFIGPIATAGNLGQAAVVGNFYLVLRAIDLSAATASFKF